MNKVLVCGSGGFIGGHLTKRLKSEGKYVIGADLLPNAYDNMFVDEFYEGDLRDENFVSSVMKPDIKEIYQLAADMGGAGYIFTGENDVEIMHNSVLCNLNILKAARELNSVKILFSSSACIYPQFLQMDELNPDCAEDSAYPANPDSEYGWEKLFSERLYKTYSSLNNIEVRVARLHNIFGPMGAWSNGKEKAPAALCRKVASASDGSSIDVWGDGLQTRSFLYIDECLEGFIRFMNSDFSGPLNIGSEEMISINDLAKTIIEISGKNLSINNINGPVGVRGRRSDNTLIQQKLNWQPTQELRTGLVKTYQWILSQINEGKLDSR